MRTEPVRDEFIVAACVPIQSSHSSGTLEQAEVLPGSYPAQKRTPLVLAVHACVLKSNQP
jgi:hypothetical protein